MRRAVAIVLAIWAVGIVLAEGVQQAGAGATVLLALVLFFRKSLRLEPDVRALNLSRLQENFGTEEEPRYAAGGFLFHRLRFSHGAIAILGPALAELARGRVPWHRVLAGAVGLALLASVHLLLARALVRRHRAGSVAATGALLAFGGFHVLSLVHYLPFHSSVHLSFAFIWGRKST